MSVRVEWGGGKHVVVFGSRAELEAPVRGVQLPAVEPAPGLLLPSGDINWACPCLGGMATGPCGLPFRDAFSCFHYSEADPKGSDCYEKFSVMQECMSQYPQLYGRDDDDDVRMPPGAPPTSSTGTAPATSSTGTAPATSSTGTAPTTSSTGTAPDSPH